LSFAQFLDVLAWFFFQKKAFTHIKKRKNILLQNVKRIFSLHFILFVTFHDNHFHPSMPTNAIIS
jgi:MUN domain